MVSAKNPTLPASKCAGIYIGPTFIDLTYQNSHQRFYIPKNSIKNSLNWFFSQPSLKDVERVQISLEYLKKLLQMRLGGSVAQLVTLGAENWMNIRQLDNDQSDLSKEELIFPIQERINYKGTITEPLSFSELELVEEKMKSQEIKRVAIHFLHAEKNNAHQKMAFEFLSNKGYDLFIPPADGTTAHEGHQWLTNILNASLHGTCIEMRKEILSALEPFVPKENIKFTGDTISNQMLSAHSLRAQYLHLQKIPSAIYLGFNQFDFINSEAHVSTWRSPWGTIQSKQPESYPLSIQPLSEVELNLFQELDFNHKAISTEPGTMALGRGLKPTFFDLWADEIKSHDIPCASEQIHDLQTIKIRSQILALAKNSRKKPMAFDGNYIFENFKKYSLQKMSIDILQFCQNQKPYLFGPLAPVFYNGLSQYIPEISLIESPFIESQILAREL